MRVTLYSKPQCPLCDDVRAMLEGLTEEFPHHLVEVNILSEQTLIERYGEEVPVVQVGAYTLKAPFDRRDLRVTLGAASDGASAGKVGARKMGRDQAVFLNKAVLFFGRHWLALFNLLVLLYVGLPFAAPTLMRAGAERPARLIYKAYSPMCHQLAFRSWFLFGEQAAYPRALAGTAFRPFGEVTGLDEGDLYEARAFVGDAQVGYKVALCERDVAIYGGIFLSGLAFALLRGRLRPLPLGLWVLIGIVPIAMDGGSQLISGIPLPLLSSFPARESTPFLRTLTGALFGLSNVWMAYPYVEETMAETRALVAAKLTAAEGSAQAS
jgi:uncharacterized membrane protein/glutaredoxin